MNGIERIQSQQRAWAEQNGIPCDSRGYAVTLQLNLYSFPLLQETRSAFESGMAQELRTSAGQGRMRALNSSSALVVNFFEYWQRHGVSDIAKACGSTGLMTRMSFERRHSSLLGGMPCHIDVEFEGENTGPLAVKSKFTEPYHRLPNRQLTQPYWPKFGLWSQLPRCRRMAKRIWEDTRGRDSYVYLDASQLLKEILALSASFGRSGFELLYLWYDVPSPEADRHRDEIREFIGFLREEVLLREMSYQQLFDAVKSLPGVKADYVSYMAGRYFPDIRPSSSDPGIEDP